MMAPNPDRKVPRCTRGNHHCDDLCADAPGEPCSPESGAEYDWWYPKEGPQRRYRILKSALPIAVALTLTEKQERYLRWLAGKDDETAQVVASLIAAGRPAPRVVLCPSCGHHPDEHSHIGCHHTGCQCRDGVHRLEG